MICAEKLLKMADVCVKAIASQTWNFFCDTVYMYLNLAPAIGSEMLFSVAAVCFCLFVFLTLFSNN